MNLVTLAVTPFPELLDYGDGVIRIAPGAQPPPGTSAVTHDLFQATLVEVGLLQGGGPGPVRVLCAAAGQAHACDRCTGSSCTGGPPPPDLLTGSSTLAIRKSDVIFPSDMAEIQIMPQGQSAPLGPILCPTWSGPPPTVVGALTTPLAAALNARGQTDPVVFHLYYLAKPGHPLHERVIAIPVALSPPDPGLGASSAS